jgi:hypothetical protein
MSRGRAMGYMPESNMLCPIWVSTKDGEFIPIPRKDGGTEKFWSREFALPDVELINELIINPGGNSTNRFHPESNRQPECRGAVIL